MSFKECTEGADSGPELAVPPWYLAYARPRMESTAVVNLERQGFEAYLPMFKTCRNTPEGLQPAYEPLFPRYVFLRPRGFNHSVSVVASTRGVCCLVRFGGETAQVSREMIAGIREFELQRSQAGLETISPIQPGAKVRMRKGGLQGLEGLVVSVARQRVTFLLELLGREKEVTVDHGELVLA